LQRWRVKKRVEMSFSRKRLIALQLSVPLAPPGLLHVVQ